LPDKADIVEKLTKITQPGYIDCLKDVVNPYDKPDTAQEILSIIRSRAHIPVVKKFYDVEAGGA
jgi:UDP-N-acetylglucosamine 2-epimerase